MALLFTLAVDAVSAYFLSHEIASYSFSETSGKIVSGTVEKRKRSGKKIGSDYTPRIGYTYEVDGKTLVGEGIHFSDSSFSMPHQAERVLARFPVGSDVSVYYDPADPGRSVLVRGISGIGIFFLLALINLGFVFLVWLRVVPRKTRA